MNIYWLLRKAQIISKDWNNAGDTYGLQWADGLCALKLHPARGDDARRQGLWKGSGQEGLGSHAARTGRRSRQSRNQETGLTRHGPCWWSCDFPASSTIRSNFLLFISWSMVFITVAPKDQDGAPHGINRDPKGATRKTSPNIGKIDDILLVEFHE